MERNITQILQKLQKYVDIVRSSCYTFNRKVITQTKEILGGIYEIQE
jgi:hypothetical protein